ncbi:E3 ubiquitin/ISG15 ligase TRIM25-like [Protopterus annectens]|uniref:E3 ubiquitin/ISG15 ligase TRIM25-like n=1 Tax=Protopterus annectens TaxID=7888 RepID=UPI001CFBAA2F|nr:E3 ubiquitin/ISG15 ligase TRIM25-like [Protopterus annectens]
MAAEASTLWQLAQDLTCPVCLQTFENPVTTPCGHSYCQDCLAKAWRQVDETGFFRCPQCRYSFPEKPNINKSTSLQNILTRLRGNTELEGNMLQPGEIPCDICQAYKAEETCLTCIASYCQTHIKPHLNNPVFKDHLRTDPLKDLQERKCQDHIKLLEFYCKEHAECLCCVCLANHNLCEYSTMEEERRHKETNLRDQLTVLENKIQAAEEVIGSIKLQKKYVKETASETKANLEKAFTEIKLLIKEEEAKARRYVQQEETRLQEQIQVTLDTFSKMCDHLSKMKAQISQQISAANSMAIFQKTIVLDLKSSDDLSNPVIETDMEKLQNICNSVPLMKNLIKYQICRILKEKLLPAEWPETNEKESPTKSRPKTEKRRQSLFKSRNEFLEYASKPTLDICTAHRRISLSKEFCRVSLTDTPQDYPDSPQRFLDCFQVLSTEEFSTGCHYWEVNMSEKSFCSIGIAYRSIKRMGLESLFGRNTSSWCIEKFNLKLYTWHADNEICLPNPDGLGSVVGIFLNCDEGFVSFYSVTDTMTILHEYQIQVKEPVCLAIGIFSSTTTLELCDLH